MAPPPAHDSDVLPWLYDCLVFLRSIPHCELLPHIPSVSFPLVNSRRHLGVVLHFLCSSSQTQHITWDLCTNSGYVGLWQILSVWFSFYSDSHRSAVALFYRLKCFPSVQTIDSMCGSDTCFSSQPPQVQFQSCSLSSFSFPCIILTSFVWVYIPFQWSGTLAHSQLVFCDIFCIWRCVSDALMERDVLHIHLLLHHLVSPHS